MKALFNCAILLAFTTLVGAYFGSAIIGASIALGFILFVQALP